MIKAVIFDFDSTLVDFLLSDKKAISQVYNCIRVNVELDEFWEKSGDIIADLYNTNADLGPNVHETRLKATFMYFDVAWKDEYLPLYLNTYLREVEVYIGVKDILENLSKKVRIGLLTNSVDSKEQRMRIINSGLADYFDEIAIANEIGYYKPATEAFHHVLGKLSVKPNEAIFIGDSEKYDIEGAKKSGLNAIKKVKNFNYETMADYSFREYHELREVLSEHYSLSI